MSVKLYSNKSIMHVLSGFMQDPFRLRDSNRYKISPHDFPDAFHKIIFITMHSLVHEGVNNLNPIEIEGYISSKPDQKMIYDNNDGLQYLKALQSMPSENFDYHYEQVRKYTLLRHYKSVGVDVSDILDENIIDFSAVAEQQSEFDAMSVQDILDHIEFRVREAREIFEYDIDNVSGHMSKNLDALVEKVEAGESFGSQLITPLYTAITYGAVKQRFHLLSADSGVGKSKFDLATIALLTVTHVYNKETKQFEKNKYATGKSGLYIGVELLEEEVKIPILCMISQVDEYKVKSQKLTQNERQRFHKAKEILAQSPLWFEDLPEFNAEDLEYIISKHVIKNDIQYFAHDYIEPNDKIFEQMKHSGRHQIQEHQALRQMSTTIKTLARKYDIFALSNTQTNDKVKEEIYDQSAIAGARAIAQKVDVGAIMAKVSVKDQKIIDTLRENGNLNLGFGFKEPNTTINFYKNRGSRWSNVRLWVYFNRGTLTMEDCFVTDMQGNLITDIEPVEIIPS